LELRFSLLFNALFNHLAPYWLWEACIDLVWFHIGPLGGVTHSVVKYVNQSSSGIIILTQACSR
jgi:hypothetical protein